jgi:hypothetical protein
MKIVLLLNRNQEDNVPSYEGLNSILNQRPIR